MNLSDTCYELTDAVAGYLTCALWSSADDDGPFDDGRTIWWDDRSLLTMWRDVACFLHDNWDDVTHMVNEEDADWDDIGHNFWLSRNRHGTGFWDRDWGERGDRLHASARDWGSADLTYDNGKVYLL